MKALSDRLTTSCGPEYLKKDVTSWVKTCLICQGNKVQCHNFNEFKPFALLTGRFQEINLDM